MGTRTGFVVEKKSISFPIVNGILIETEDETSNNPIAMSNGFRSGFAREMIFRNDEAVSGDFLKSDRTDGFGEGGVTGFGAEESLRGG